MVNHLAAEHNYNPSIAPGQKGYKTMGQMKEEWRNSSLGGFGSSFGAGYIDDRYSGSNNRFPGLDHFDGTDRFGGGLGGGTPYGRNFNSNDNFISSLPTTMDIEPLVSGRVRGSSRQAQEPPSTDAQLQLALAASEASASNLEEELLRKVLAESRGEDPATSSSASSSTTSSSFSSSSVSSVPNSTSRSFTTTTQDLDSKMTSNTKPAPSGYSGAPPVSGHQGNVVKCPYCDTNFPAFDDLVTHMARCPKAIR